MNHSFRYTLTLKELGEFTVFSVWSDPDLKNTRRKMLFNTFFNFLCGSVLGVLLGLFISKGFPRKIEINTVILFCTSIALAAIFTINAYLNIAKKTQKAAEKKLATEENYHMLFELSISLDEDGITNTDSRSQSKITWDAIVKTAITKEAYYLYFNSFHAFIIPKRILNNKSEEKALELFLETHIKKGTIKRLLK